MLPKNFYDLVEQPGILKNILYGDTDSLFITIPIKDSDKLSTEDKLKISDKVSEEINGLIIKYLNEYFLPKSNISTNYMSTYFKSEMLMEAIMFLDVKKNYACKILAKKGKIFSKPKISYTGIQVVKSDAAKATQDMLKEMIEDIVLNPNIQTSKERLEKVSAIVTKYHDKCYEDINNLELSDITFPGKWSKKAMFVNGMTLYNFIMNKEVFAMGSAGMFIYCKFKNLKLFQKSNIPDMTKVNGIVVPYIYDKVLLDKKLKEYQIEIDKETQWEKLLTTTCIRVIDLIKKEK